MNVAASTPEEVQEAVRAATCVLPHAGKSKPALSTPPEGVVGLAVDGLRGILAYEPNEYTFTAYAGTPVAEVAAALAEHGQYLPFDPVLVARGATLGGTVAANLSGPGRYRYGGVRDFILAVEFVDGQGRLVRSGGKVVKNAAGFDLPKFFVGSLGRYGVLVTLTFKVFPRPAATATLAVAYPGLAAAKAALFRLAPTPFELDALDLVPEADGAWRLVARLGGLEAAQPARLARLADFLARETGAPAGEVWEGAAEAAYWDGVNDFTWADPVRKGRRGRRHPGRPLVKIPLGPRALPALEATLAAWPRRYTAGGHVAWVSPDAPAALDEPLRALGLAGLVFAGPADGGPILGLRQGEGLARRVKAALDPTGRFPADADPPARGQDRIMEA